jgi:hypothetical protein
MNDFVKVLECDFYIPYIFRLFLLKGNPAYGCACSAGFTICCAKRAPLTNASKNLMRPQKIDGAAYYSVIFVGRG